MKDEKGLMLIMVPIFLIILGIGISLVANDSDVVTRANESRNSVNNLSQQDKNAYNSVVEQYLGDSVKGTPVKAMMDDVISSNSANVGQKGKFISIEAENITGYDKSNILKDSCEIAKKNNNVENVKSATTEIQNLRVKINSSKNYKLTVDYENGVIVKVIVQEL